MPEKRSLKKTLSPGEEHELDVRINFMEGILRREPACVEALQALGEDYTKRGLYMSGLKVDEQLAQMRPEDALVHYNLACSCSLTGNFNRALASLERSIELGYRDFKWLARDPDLAEVRRHPLYKNILARVRDLKEKQT